MSIKTLQLDFVQMVDMIIVKYMKIHEVQEGIYMQFG